MRRLLVACGVVLAALGVLVPAAAVGSHETDVTIRIVAQRHEDGRVEFAVIQQQPDGSWGDRVAPRARFFPADTEAGRWLRSSPVALASTGEARQVPAPTTTTAPPSGLHIADNYWSDNRWEYFVVIGGLSRHHTYCEAHLTRDGRRIGEWGNDLWSGSRSRVTISIFLGMDSTASFDGVEVECR